MFILHIHLHTTVNKGTKWHEHCPALTCIGVHIMCKGVHTLQVLSIQCTVLCKSSLTLGLPMLGCTERIGLLTTFAI